MIHRLGVDTLEVFCTDKHGNPYLIVVIVQLSKFVGLYPTKDKLARTLACLFEFIASYGIYEQLIFDPGCDLASDFVAQLHFVFP